MHFINGEAPCPRYKFIRHKDLSFSEPARLDEFFSIRDHGARIDMDTLFLACAIHDDVKMAINFH